ncbi:Zinc finger, CW-type [Dillenia turbinata]|uniref:Zinc finger, CW-type n=1 Tax=Dillenia turbinata TaxID=194707 RepID=A0AAN8ZA48_9MAGN
MATTPTKLCMNYHCKEVKSEPWRRGWRLRNGDFANLCDRCGSAFEEGRFCDAFHSYDSGWRQCVPCGKRLHCGCIASVHTMVVLDYGGVSCITCARKTINILPTPNPVWPPSLFLSLPTSDRVNVKNWSQTPSSGSIGTWRQAPILLESSSQSELHHGMPSEVDISGGIERRIAGEQLSAFLEKKKTEDMTETKMNGSLKLGTSEMLESGTKRGEKPRSCIYASKKSSSKDDLSAHFGPAVPSLPNETNGQSKGSGAHLKLPTPSTPLTKQFNCNPINDVETSGETQVRNGRPRAEGRRTHLLPRYWPRITDEELQQISGDPNSVITPLFEKTLSASDAGRIGRLVLPKKCAEAYFPPISQPEGLPLKVQDFKGKEWVFQFRFWPNNNSRMYVLEGVTPCIQTMQLQAGDTVTFSRLEPEGKLVMGFRKASSVPLFDQGNQTLQTANGVSAPGDVNPADAASMRPNVDKSGYIAKEIAESKSPFPGKRKNSTLGSRSKRLRIENEDLVELKLTWEEAQGLLRPPPNHVPSVMVIDGVEFEEYEEPPILGKPTIFATDDEGKQIQWAQCEDCFKWRSLPVDFLLPSRFTCSDKSSNAERLSCSTAPEITAEQLEELLPVSNQVSFRKMKATRLDPETVEALEGLDTLANLAILGEGETLSSSAQATTKHPRHRPGCSCIVCIQPPSGKGPKHKQTCTCNVCLTVKRRFRTLMLRRERKQSEKEAEIVRKKHHQQLPERLEQEDDPLISNDGDNSSSDHRKPLIEGFEEEMNTRKCSTSPFKGQIDLNIQPEREEELSPGSDSSSMLVKLLQDATERNLKQQKLSNFIGNIDTTSDQAEPSGRGTGEDKLGSDIKPVGNHQDSSVDISAALLLNASSTTTATDR